MPGLGCRRFALGRLALGRLKLGQPDLQLRQLDLKVGDAGGLLIDDPPRLLVALRHLSGKGDLGSLSLPGPLRGG